MQMQIFCSGHSDEEKWDIGYQITQGLVHLHEDVGMVHRDLKPSNILLTDKMVVKLCDFGISRGIAPPENENDNGSDTLIGGGPDNKDVSGFGGRSAGNLSRVVTMVGTVEYMAPECFDGSLAHFSWLQKGSTTGTADSLEGEGEENENEADHDRGDQRGIVRRQ